MWNFSRLEAILKVLMNILLGLLFLGLGIAMVVFAQQIWNFTGAIDFVEKYMPGNTKAFIQLVGVVIVILSLFFITGLGSTITGPIGDTLGKLFGQSK